MVRHGVLKEGHMPPFRGRSWEEVRDWYAELGWPKLEPLVDVVDSVLKCGGAERLVANTSMHDLWVARMVDDAAASAVDVIEVCSSSSRRAVRRGEVLVVHTSHSGHEEEISRPGSDAVPLFWRFVREKWGIEPCRWEVLGAAERHVLQLASQGARLCETTRPSVVGGPVEGLDSAERLTIPEAQHVTGELMRQGMVRLVAELHGRTRQLDDEELVRVFAGLTAWTDPGGAPLIRLQLSAAGAKWYEVRGRTT